MDQNYSGRIAMYQKILIPVENQTYTDGAILAHLRPLARLMNSELIVIHVADGWAARNYDQLELQESEEIKSDRAYVENLAKGLASEGFQARAILAMGDPADEIIKAAEENGADLIAMATHGHKGLEDVVRGSVANKLRHITKVPVLMVRAPGGGK
jgi:nucleotide-binding universal stress UspA family protein